MAWILLSISLCATIGLAIFSPIQFHPATAWLFIGALGAFFLPVAWGKRGWSLRFTLPFYAALAAVSGPVLPIIIDLGFGLGEALGKRRLRRLALPNASLTLLSGAIAGWAIVPIENPWIASSVYAILHFTVNLLGAKLLDRRPIPMQIGGFEMGANLVMAVLTLIFALEMPILVLLMLVPILGVRMLCEERNRAAARQEHTVLLLADLLQRAHPGTHRHLERCAQIAEDVALRSGLSPAVAQRVRSAAILHDIGKIAVDEAVLDKPAKLTDEEYTHVKAHVAYGEEILRSSEQFADIRTWIRHHHETPVGTGYPDGLAGDQIPLPSRIIAVVDAFDAMTGGIDGQDRRPYKEPMSIADAIAELDRCTDRQFDRAVVKHFKETLTAGGIR
jgi:putative nucleotidyltransferase with HDIG domain